MCGHPTEHDGGACDESEEDVGEVAAPGEAPEEQWREDYRDSGQHGAFAADLVSWNVIRSTFYDVLSHFYGWGVS